MIPLTDEQQAAVDYPDNLALTSCPGSGKTRTIIAKVMKCLDEIRDTARRIACITFTNTGVEEIESRLRRFSNNQDNKLCEVSTIHSFCLTNILRPFSHLIPLLKGDWELLTADDEWFTALVTELIHKHGISRNEKEKFETLHRTFPDGRPSKTDLPLDVVQEFFQRIDEEKKVVLNDIVYYSARLVEGHQFIASALAARFAWFIVDEFQDTTLAQARLLYRVFQEKRSKFFIVGDPNQSILSVAGAHPNLMASFAQKVGARVDITLSGNFRSSQVIIEKAELLCKCTPKMVAVGKYKAFAHRPEYHHCESAVEGIVEYFIPAMDALGISEGKTAILAPWWRDLLSLGKELRRRGIPIVGPGSRPYKKSNEFALLAESLAAFLGQNSSDSASAVQKSLFVTLSTLTETANWQLYRYDGQRTVFRIINAARNAHEKYLGAISPWLLEVAKLSENILISEDLLPEARQNVFVNSAQAMLTEMTNNGYDVANVSVVELGMVAKPEDCIHLLSMHKSKGKEFDAVAVVNLHDNRLPFFGCQTDSERDEYRRLLYVAATRARKLLMLFTDSSHYRNTPSRYLGKPYLDMC